MIQDFTKEELEPVASDRDTELTLSSGALLVLGAGLFLLCAACFGIGYSIGHRAKPDQDALNIPPSVSKPAVTPTGSGTKPGAGQAQVQPSMQPPDDASSGSMDVASNSTPPETVPASAAASASSTQAHIKPAVEDQIRPALTPQPSAASPAPAFQVQPAMNQVQGWMVQIAAVSHPADAEVLVNALRRRGYTVTARREVSDSLIHVQTGPFVNRNDANSIRQRLLSDGYNAIVQ